MFNKGHDGIPTLQYSSIKNSETLSKAHTLVIGAGTVAIVGTATIVTPRLCCSAHEKQTRKYKVAVWQQAGCETAQASANTFSKAHAGVIALKQVTVPARLPTARGNRAPGLRAWF